MKTDKKNFYKLMVIAGFILWFAETAYFGFNKTPVNGIEGTLDTAAFLWMGWGIMGDISSNLTFRKVNNFYAEKTEVNNIQAREDS